MQITLDYHTARFFEDMFHRGEAKQRFHLQGLGERIFGGRPATSRNGQNVLICQESRVNTGDSVEGIGPIFVIEESLSLASTEHLAHVAFGVIRAQKFDCKPAPVRSHRTHLPIFEAGVWRYHVDQESGWGCRVNPYGYVYLRDLAHTPAEQEKEWFLSPAMLGWGLRPPATLGSASAALLDRGADDFHHHLDDAATYESSYELNEAIDFYAYSDEQLCRGILKGDLATRELAEERMSHFLAAQSQLGDAWADASSWTWSMWIDDASVFVRLANGTTQLRTPPESWLRTRDTVLENLGCCLAPSDLDLDTEEGWDEVDFLPHIMRARTWAAQFTCASQ